MEGREKCQKWNWGEENKIYTIKSRRKRRKKTGKAIKVKEKKRNKLRVEGKEK